MMTTIDIPKLKRKLRYICRVYHFSESLKDRLYAAVDSSKVPLIDLYDWFSVEDRYPNDGDSVLTIDSEGVMEVYQYDIDWPNCFVKWDGIVKVFNITHWMPLPEPPKKED